MTEQDSVALEADEMNLTHYTSVATEPTIRIGSRVRLTDKYVAKYPHEEARAAFRKGGTVTQIVTNFRFGYVSVRVRLDEFNNVIGSRYIWRYPSDLICTESEDACKAEPEQDDLATREAALRKAIVELRASSQEVKVHENDGNYYKLYQARARLQAANDAVHVALGNSAASVEAYEQFLYAEAFNAVRPIFESALEAWADQQAMPDHASIDAHREKWRAAEIRQAARKRGT